MRERHNWSSSKHPPTCTCATCEQRRAEALQPKPKKKRKPKSQRGKPKQESAPESSSIFDEVKDLLDSPPKKPDDYRKDDLDA